MHACLKVPEILLSIFDYIEDTYEEGDEDDDFEHHKPTLATLASTCRGFHEPAVSILWETQNSLAPLVQVMPTDLWDRTRDRDKIFFQRPLSEEDWDRFEHYSPKIRHLNIDFRFGVAMDVLVRLFAYRPLKRLLPGLCSCSICTYPDPSILEYIPPLLGESLQRLSIDEINASVEQINALQYLLQSIVRCFPDLLHIALPYGARSIESLGPQVSLARFLDSFTALKSVELHWSDVTPEVLRSLTNLKQLESLCLGLWRDCSDQELGRIAKRLGDIEGKGIFDASAYLTTLKLHYAAAHHIRQILHACPKAIHYVELDSITREERFNELVTTLGRFPQTTYLSLDYRDSDMLFPDNEYPSLTPLLSLHHLREVFLIGLPSIVLTDQLLQNISKMWPDLNILDTRPKEEETTQMTLEGLIPLAESCNNLVNLTISVICRPFDLSRITQRSNASHLQRLVLSSSPLEQPWKVLRCISHLFPKAISVKGSGPNDDTSSWKDMNLKLKEAFA